MLDCLQLLSFYSSTMMTAAVTTLTALGNDRQKFLTTQLEDELVFKGGEGGGGHVIGRNKGPSNKSDLIKAIYILPIC
jgi:hypothetical protein